MTKEEWLAKAREHAEDLKSLVGNYHPSAGQLGRHAMEITAPAAEAACLVREKIQDEESRDPIRRLEAALVVGDAGEIYSVLDEAWFGVPESTSCWQIRGFADAVDLMDDPPEMEEPDGI